MWSRAGLIPTQRRDTDAESIHELHEHRASLWFGWKHTEKPEAATGFRWSSEMLHDLWPCGRPRAHSRRPPDMLHPGVPSASGSALPELCTRKQPRAVSVAATIATR